MKRTLIFILLLSFCSIAARAQETYFTIDDMPDLVKCLPAPPDTVSIDFTHDVMQYMWGKTMRDDAYRAAIAERDAIWDLDTLAAVFSESFGLKIDKEATPEIYKAFVNGVSTIELIRIRPKAHFMRKRPFDRFQEHMYTTWEEDELRGEGSYPSGHTIRGWSAALLLSEINPAAANDLYARGWEYGESRVIVGAHWQSDVDASRPAASIGYSLLQTSPEYRAQMDKARKEFAIYEAIDRYLAETIGTQYREGDVCIPLHPYIYVDESNKKDLQVLGDFWVFNYDIEGDTLKTVSGGSHPGKMHLKQDPDGNYYVSSFDAVEEGSRYLPTARRIFGNRLEAFQAASSNDVKRGQVRKDAIACYVARNRIPVSYYQDYGWDAVSIFDNPRTIVPEYTATATAVDNLWTYSHTHPDGFTLNINTWEEPEEGIAVAYSATQDSHGRDDLEFVVNHARSNGGHVGGWLDSETGRYYFDSICLFPEDSIEEAINFGRENGQIAIYVLSSGEEIRLEGDAAN